MCDLQYLGSVEAGVEVVPGEAGVGLLLGVNSTSSPCTLLLQNRALHQILYLQKEYNSLKENRAF